MKPLPFLVVFICFCFHALSQDAIVYPNAYQSNQVDTIWHTAVKDPYRWMEDIRSTQVEEWLNEQKKLTNKYSGQTSVLEEYLGYYSALHFKPLVREGKYYFSLAYNRFDNTCELYYQDGIQDDPTELFDPNILDRKNDISIDDYRISDDSKTLALMLAKNGSDWKTIRFLNINKERLLNDTINFVKFSDIHWFRNGIFYRRYNVKGTEESFKGLIKNPSLYYHKIGTNQRDDKLIYTDTNKSGTEFEFFAKSKVVIKYHDTYHDNRNYHVVSIANLDSTLNFNFRDILYTSIDSVYFHVIGKLGNKWIVKSNLDAPNGALYLLDLSSANKLERFIPECAEQLGYCKIMQDKLICAYSNDSVSYLVIWDSAARITNNLKLLPGRTFGEFSGNSSDSILIFSFYSFFTPATMYMININTGHLEDISVTRVHFDWKGITTKKVYYKSKDGTTIPMYLTYKIGTKLDGKNPLILYGYGGFDLKMQPYFDPANIIFFQNGGILAAPCIRGGGDYPGWHEQGMRLKKQNTFNDFIAAAEYLIANKYTSSDKMAAMGGSNGGLLVAAVMLQRPDLFRVVVADAGVLDMLRYHLFDVGSDEYIKEEYGNITDSSDFRNLIKYSPVQNVRKGVTYPATLLAVGDNDDRVNPFQSFKFLASLQANGVSTKNNPYILYYENKAGHTGTKNIEKGGEDEAFVYSFIFKYLGIANKISLPEN